MSQMLRLEQGSTPVVGSSRTTKREPPMKAMEIDSLRFIPPDRVPTRLCLWAYMPVSSRILRGKSMKVCETQTHVNTTVFFSLHLSRIQNYSWGISSVRQKQGNQREVEVFVFRFSLIGATFVMRKSESRNRLMTQPRFSVCSLMMLQNEKWFFFFCFHKCIQYDAKEQKEIKVIFWWEIVGLNYYTALERLKWIITHF